MWHCAPITPPTPFWQTRALDNNFGPDVGSLDDAFNKGGNEGTCDFSQKLWEIKLQIPPLL